METEKRKQEYISPEREFVCILCGRNFRGRLERDRCEQCQFEHPDHDRFDPRCALCWLLVGRAIQVAVAKIRF